ncbi:MAG: transcription-repair coupling factor [Steroidobacteraceae bacterium]
MTADRLLGVPLPAPAETLAWGELYGSARALAIVELALEAHGPVLVVAETNRQAVSLQGELTFFAGTDLPVRALPGHETLPYDPFSPHPDIVSERLETLAALPHLRRGVVIVSADTLTQRLPPRQHVEAHSFDLVRGTRLDLTAFRSRLSAAGYAAVGQVMAHGEYAIRGSVIDLFPMGAGEPLRLDLFDDEIETIRHFDPQSQRSTGALDALRLLPAREFPTTPEAVTAFRQRWRAVFEGDPTRSPVYRSVSEGLAPAGIESWLPLFFERLASVFDYLPGDTTVVLAGEVRHGIGTFLDSVEERYEQRRHDLERPLLPPASLYLTPEEIEDRLGKLACVIAGSAKLDPLSMKGRWHNSGSTVPPALRIDPRSEDPAGALRHFLAGFAGPVLLVADSAGRRETILELLRGQQLDPRPVQGWSEFLAAKVPLAVCAGAGIGSLVLPGPGLAIIAEDQLFGERARQERRRRRADRDPGVILQELTDLSPGAPVVHEAYGVGRYLGLRVMDVEGHPGEFLVIEYAAGDRIYVPVQGLDQVSRYTGASPDSAPLHKLGSDQWARARRKAAERIRDVAAELLDLYARRAARQGQSVALREAEYQAFAAAFPFEETPDQAEAIRQVLADLASGQPMDRVVCGDVGFGKTEVALRAAFTVAMAGRQVAVLVPTTLLAQQHARNFADRFADWPIRVEDLSRFRTAAEQKRVIAGLKDGAVDVVIGTQRLLQRDVAFKALGLVIIDEEHRFGVRDKERLRQLRADVDTLTLTATPIPRTLNMALGGLRDLSLITTAPAERMSIETFICEWNDGLIREALLREIRRGGQAYFVHNAVETIEQTAARLGELVPEAVVRYAHGQMRESELERLMLDFFHQRFNVLVCTTIIESGIDIPTANTILIDRADKLGLAQLHQLRGRVGRSHHRAFAYLIAPNRKALSVDAARRLEAIESLEDLGAGFTLATHDMEIRGAGELLGEGQSGQIQEVGFSLYMEMLERAVEAMRAGREPELERPLHSGPEVELQVPALLPEDYVADVSLRLRLYKRISSAGSDEALSGLREELVDRFGPLPEPALTLFRVAALRSRAARLGLERVEFGAAGGLVVFGAGHSVDPLKVIKLIQGQPDRYRMDGPERLRVRMDLADPDLRVRMAERLVSGLEPG